MEENMAQVQKKILSEYFKKVISGEKKTELRCQKSGKSVSHCEFCYK